MLCIHTYIYIHIHMFLYVHMQICLMLMSWGGVEIVPLCYQASALTSLKLCVRGQVVIAPGGVDFRDPSRQKRLVLTLTA